MSKRENAPVKFESIQEAFKTMGVPAPQHPLIALINGIDTVLNIPVPNTTHVLNFYKISFRPNLGGTIKYGQNYFDFNNGGMLFAAPNQVIGKNEHSTERMCMNSQISLLIHPDFLLGYPLAKKIKEYNYFSYAANEALHLSEQEKATILSIFKILEEELNSRIDEFSNDVIVAQIELLLNYANRFYKRQFITRKQASNSLLQQLDELLEAYFTNNQGVDNGIPTVQYLASCLHMSPSYLSDMLRSLTGQNTQQHIHNKLIEKAKEKLSTTNLSVSQIAFELGFEHPQSFSKLFKRKTNQSPMVFREQFN